MNHASNKQHYMKFTKYLSAKPFRCCMAGIVMICLIIIAVPDHVYGEEATPQDTSLTDTLAADEGEAEDMEDTDLDDVDLEEFEEEDDTEELEEVEEPEAAETENKKTSSNAKSKEKKTAASQKTPQTQTSSTSSEKRRLDSIPQTGENDVKAMAGLAGTIALGFYLFSKRLRV